MKSKNLRAITATLLFAGVAVAGLIAGPAYAEGEAEPKPCRATKFEFKQVEKECTKEGGGQLAAKTMMKKVVKKAKAAGETMNCKSCHSDTKTYELKDNAVEDLKKWL